MASGRQAYEEPSEARILGAYLFGVVGVLAALTFAIVLATDAGWIEKARLRIEAMRMPDLPTTAISSTSYEPVVSAGGILDSIVGFARNTAEFSTRSFQRHEGITRGVVDGGSPSSAPN